MLPLQSSVSELPKFWAATFCPNPDFLSYERGNCHNSLLCLWWIMKVYKMQNCLYGSVIIFFLCNNRCMHVVCTVRPRDTRPRAARTSQVHVFELGPKKLEMNEFMKWKPWAARFSDHLAFTLLSNKSCTNFELHEFFLSPKNVHLKALLYLDM